MPAAHRRRAYYGGLAANGCVLGVLLCAVAVSIWYGDWNSAIWRTLLLLIPACAIFAVLTMRAIAERNITALDLLIEQRTIERDTAQEFLGKFRRGEFAVREVPTDDPYDGRKPS